MPLLILYIILLNWGLPRIKILIEIQKSAKSLCIWKIELVFNVKLLDIIMFTWLSCYVNNTIYFLSQQWVTQNQRFHYTFFIIFFKILFYLFTINNLNSTNSTDIYAHTKILVEKRVTNVMLIFFSTFKGLVKKNFFEDKENISKQ